MTSRRIAILFMLGALAIAPCAARAQIPDLSEKAQDLIAHVRDRGAQLRPRYQDVIDQPRPAPRPHGRRRKPRRNHSASKPARALPGCCPPGAPQNNAH